VLAEAEECVLPPQSNSPRNWILTFIRVPRTPGKGSGSTRAMIGSQDMPSTH